MIDRELSDAMEKASPAWTRRRYVTYRVSPGGEEVEMLVLVDADVSDDDLIGMKPTGPDGCTEIVAWRIPEGER